MKPFDPLLSFAAVFLLAVPLLGEEPHLEFVRGLRANGMPDLALQYLQSKRQNPPADLAPVLPLELAKTRLELAMTEADPTRRAVVQNQAKVEFDTFLKNNPKHPLAAEAALEIARIGALQGKAQLTHARQQDVKEIQHGELLKARLQFEEAGKKLQAALAAITGQLKNYTSPSTSQAEVEKQALQQAKMQADLEQGVNLLDQAATYTEDNEAAKRGELLKTAIDLLTKLSKEDSKNPLCWQALAWLGRCHQVNDDPKSARAVYKDVIAEPGEAAETGRRLARYFRLQALLTDPDVKKPQAEIQRGGEEWLVLYPNYLNTPEGFGVRYELAKAYLQQATVLSKNQQQARGARELFDKAQKLFQALEQTENDYTAEAHELRLKIILAVSQERTKGDISKLRDFEECYLRAQLEKAHISEAAKKFHAEELEGKRKQHFLNMIEALSRGLDLADAKVNGEELDDARYLLAYAYLATEDYYRAAVIGEELARGEPKSPHAALAGAYALRSYGLLIPPLEQAGAAKEDLDIIRGRLRKLALYIEQSWPTDSSADIARHMLALLLLNEKNYPEAVTVLERISESYPDATQAFFQLAEAALQAEKDEARPPAGKPPYQQRAMAALAKVPELASGADPGTVRGYFFSKLMLADIYYKTKQYEKIDLLANVLRDRLAGLDDKTKAEYHSSVVALSLYARQGQAETEYAAGRYDKARAVLDPIVNQVKDPAQQAQWSDLKEKNPQLLRALLSLALRSNVQDNKGDRAKEILELFQKIFPENSLDILVQFVQQLREQIQQLRQQGDPAQVQLDKTVKSFSAFLDELVKQQEKSPRADITVFLAQSYSSLDDHARAAELANRITEPKAAEGKSEPDKREVQIYHAARLLYVRELRLNQEFDKADKVLKAVQATSWGERNPEARKERILLLEDQEKYGGKEGAIAAWNNLMLQMKPRLQDNKIKEQYFDCYYHFTYCIFKNGLNMKDPQKRLKSIQAAANYIIRLEAQPDAAVEPCKKRFEELLQKQPLLKEQYDELKKGAQ